MKTNISSPVGRLEQLRGTMSKQETQAPQVIGVGPQLKAFKRAPSLGLSMWHLGSLTTNLAEKKDTNGAFCLVEGALAPGSEPPPHVHTREDELFYVLEGEFDVYVGKEAFKVEAGECVFLLRFTPHAFVSLNGRQARKHLRTVVSAALMLNDL